MLNSSAQAKYKKYFILTNTCGGYKYTYDKANRLLEADYAFKYLNIYNDTTWDYTMRDNEKIDGYDRNGNIQRLERFHGT